MDTQPNTTAGLPVPLPPPTLTRRQEAWARCVATGMSYAEAFRQAGCVASTAGSQAGQIQIMKRNPRVQARIAELKVRADADVASTIAERMAWLKLIVMANPDELSRVVTMPCDLCWPDAEIAAAWADHLAPLNEFRKERPEAPDIARPRHACQRCLGEGVSRVTLTPTDELSNAARALFKGAKQNEKGVIEIQMHDQLAAADMLNKLQSAYVTRSLNLNANVAVHAARDATPEQALALFESFGAAP